MRKNTARHWLHATLDLLPVILIPVFMIYSHRHDLSTDITIQQDVYKDFYQYVENGKPNNLDNWTNPDNQLDIYYENNNIVCDIGNDQSGTLLTTCGDIELKLNDFIYFSFEYLSNQNNSSEYYLGYNDDTFYIADGDLLATNEYKKVSFYVQQLDNQNVDNYLNFVPFINGQLYLKNIMLFNVTNIFGSGNEPTKDVFESYLTQDYYDFGSNQVKVGIIDVPAKNNDIMSVFMDSFNNSIDKYFNMGNVFGMTNVYNWFNTNIFGGNAPQVIYSVYNIVVYELVMDLLFLLYALFMWFIDMTKRLIEKPLDSIK